MASNDSPAAWYPDHADPSRLRYWDGTRWTEHRAKAGRDWSLWIALGSVFVCMLAWVCVIAVMVALGLLYSQPTIDTTPQLRVGDCLTDLEGSVVNDPHLVDCDTPHRAEVFANFDLPAGPYPGRDEVPAMTSDACKSRFKLFVGRDLDASELNQFFIWPIEATWKTNREVTCIVFDYADVTGTLKGADR